MDNGRGRCISSKGGTDVSQRAGGPQALDTERGKLEYVKMDPQIISLQQEYAGRPQIPSEFYDVFFLSCAERHAWDRMGPELLIPLQNSPRNTWTSRAIQTEARSCGKMSTVNLSCPPLGF